MGYPVEWPSAEYHEVLPRLFIGGHLWKGEDGRNKCGKHSNMSEDASWDYVISAWFDDRHPQSFPMCDTRFVIFDDTERGLKDYIWDRIKFAVDQAAGRWRDGGKVLIRCQAGYNRSGLMMALVLMRLGLTAEDAIELLRRRRGPDVLINRVFEQYVYEHEETYQSQDALAETKALVGDWDALLK